MPLNVALASSLLNLELGSNQQLVASPPQRVAPPTFHTGISTLDKDLSPTLFTDNHVIGVGIDTTHPDKSLAHEVIATHLLEPAQSSSRQQEGQSLAPAVFIVAAPDQATRSVQRIYSLLKTRLAQQQSSQVETRAAPTGTDIEPKELLRCVSLLQYLDIAGLADSVSEVLSALTRDGSTQGRTIVFVQGLAGCITATQRRSGLVQTAALVCSVLGNLRNIVRHKRCCLGLVEIEVGWVSALVGDPGRHGRVDTPGRSGRGEGRIVGMNTAFASEKGYVLKMNVSPAMQRAVGEGMDVVIAVHDGDGRIGKNDQERIVEIVRDERIGVKCAVGNWIVW